MVLAFIGAQPARGLGKLVSRASHLCSIIFKHTKYHSTLRLTSYVRPVALPKIMSIKLQLWYSFPLHQYNYMCPLNCV